MKSAASGHAWVVSIVRSGLLLSSVLHGSVSAAMTPQRVAGATSAGGDDVVAVIVVARHGIRAPIASETRDDRYNARPWPAFAVPPGVVTPHGAAALVLLGRFYRERYAPLLAEEPCRAVYAEANSTSRTVASARAMLSGLLPECSQEVHGRADGLWNPLFSPKPHAADAEILDATDGRIGGSADWFAHVFARPMDVLAKAMRPCPPGGGDCCGGEDFRAVVPAGDHQRPDLSQSAPALGADFAEHLLLEYVEGLPAAQVGWGDVDRSWLDELMEMNTRFHDFMLRTPRAAQVAASDLAYHIGRTLQSRAAQQRTYGALGTPGERFVLLDGHDSNLTWLGGLLRMDWLGADGSFNATPPGGGLVFELRHDKATGGFSVHVLFITQTLDQMRMLTPLSQNLPPAIAPVFVPGCSGAAPSYPCPLAGFLQVIARASDKRFVQIDHLAQNRH